MRVDTDAARARVAGEDTFGVVARRGDIEVAQVDVEGALAPVLGENALRLRTLGRDRGSPGIDVFVAGAQVGGEEAFGFATRRGHGEVLHAQVKVAPAFSESANAVGIRARRVDGSRLRADGEETAFARMDAENAIGEDAPRGDDSVTDVDGEISISQMRGEDGVGARPLRLDGCVANDNVGIAGACPPAVDGPGTYARRRDAAPQDFHAQRPRFTVVADGDASPVRGDVGEGSE